MAITVTSVSASELPFDGGYPLNIFGTFPVGERLRVHIGWTGTTADPVCVSGKPGQGSDIYAQVASFIRVYTPQNQAGGPFKVLVVAPDVPDQGVLDAAITFVVAPYRLGVFNLRGVLPTLYRTSARRLEQVGPLLGS